MPRVYFTDRDLGKQFPARLGDAGLQVQRQADHFEPATSDEVWLPKVGRRGWVVLTHDARIRYKTNERAAVMRHGVALLVVQGQAPDPQLAEWFVQTLPRIEGFVAEHRPPFRRASWPAGGRRTRGATAAAGRARLGVSESRK